MIDAYEIGIQLLLQEDVTAGLAVINGGLAEVDRAIAATSAELVMLAKDASKATNAVAAVASGRAALSAVSDQNPDEAAVAIGQNQPGKTVATSPAAALGENSVPAEVRAEQTWLPAIKQTNAPVMEEYTLPKPGALGPPVEPSAPVVVRHIKGVEDDPPENRTSAKSEPMAAIAPVQVEANIPRPVDNPPSIIKNATATTQAQSQSATSRSPQGALTASVDSVQKHETSFKPPGRAGDRSNASSANRRDLPAAPWSGVEQLGRQAETRRSHERAAAPQTAEQQRTGSEGGTVMLDGRLVGQWLSEHMGREASRPPAGTSFFDPRQTPAWNVSGLL